METLISEINMKKRLVIPAALAFSALCFSSCDNKLCYCYERTSDGVLHESKVYVDNDTPCNSLSRGDRGCIESSERGTINPDDIAK
jgi:hypothetical protein